MAGRLEGISISRVEKMVFGACGGTKEDLILQCRKENDRRWKALEQH